MGRIVRPRDEVGERFATMLTVRAFGAVAVAMLGDRELPAVPHPINHVPN